MSSVRPGPFIGDLRNTQNRIYTFRSSRAPIGQKELGEFWVCSYIFKVVYGILGRVVWAQVGRLPSCLGLFLVMRLSSTCQPQVASVAAP